VRLRAAGAPDAKVAGLVPATEIFQQAVWNGRASPAVPVQATDLSKM
jgi:hypothetical protein